MDDESKQLINVPVMLYDGECGFCRYWIEKLKKITRGTVRYAPYQEVLGEYPVTAEQCRESVQLIMSDGSVLSAAHAVFMAVSVSNKYRPLLWGYEHVPFFDRISEWLYQLIARHRSMSV